MADQWFCGERVPAIELAHADLPRGEQPPEHHRGGARRRQYGLGFDPALELLVQSHDRIGGAYASVATESTFFSRFWIVVRDGKSAQVVLSMCETLSPGDVGVVVIIDGALRWVRTPPIQAKPEQIAGISGANTIKLDCGDED